MTKKPDRFERIVHEQAVTIGGHSIYITDAITLLRREHAWVERMVEREPETPGPMPDEMWESVKGDRAAMEELVRIAVRLTKRNILDQLKARRS